MGAHDELMARALAPRAAAPVVSTAWDSGPEELTILVGGESVAAISKEEVGWAGIEAVGEVLAALAAAGAIVLAEGE